MKTISIHFRPENQSEQDSPVRAKGHADYKAGCRILVRTKKGIVIGKLVHCKTEGCNSDQTTFYMVTDSGKKLKFKNCRAILGEGISRQRRSPIPDDELFMWKREVRSLSVNRLIRQKSTSKRKSREHQND